LSIFSHGTDKIQLSASTGLAIVLEDDLQMDARSIVRYA